MLEQKSEIIEFFENTIEEDLELYLITWSPDPKELPDSDFYLQHNMNVDILSSYLKCCHTGLFCVESTQLGNPHYHGWYQVSDSLELHRLAVIKAMQRFGIVKIAKARTYKIFNWKEQANALYYYKKDLLDAMFTMDPNPITKDSVSTVNFDILEMVGFFNKDLRGMPTIKDTMTNRQFYRQFYGDTIGTIK